MIAARPTLKKDCMQLSLAKTSDRRPYETLQTRSTLKIAEDQSDIFFLKILKSLTARNPFLGHRLPQMANFKRITDF